MAVLHLVARSPFQSCALEHCLARAARQDAILLMENGVYAALPGSGDDLVRAALDICPIYVLLDDLRARGMARELLDGELVLVDYAGFVGLAVQYPLSITWT